MGTWLLWGNSVDSSAEEGAPRPSKGLESKSLFDFRTDSEQIFTVTKYLYQTIKQYLSPDCMKSNCVFPIKHIRSLDLLD